MTQGRDLTVRVTAAPDGDAEEVAAEATLLREELLALDVEDVRPLAEVESPHGAKGLSVVVGALLVRLASGSALRGVVGVVRRWAAVNKRDVEVTLDGDTLRLTSVTPEQQEKIIDAWLARHAGGS
jgi:hypothetical protein